MRSFLQIRRERLAASRGPLLAEARGATELAIADLRSYAVREPVSRRAYAALRIETRSGLIGYGECSRINPGELVQAKQVIQGQPATAYEAIGQQLKLWPGIRAAVDVALLDIVGKLTHAPIHQILGGPTRHKVRAMTALEGNSDNAVLASMKHALDAGFRAFLVSVPEVSARNHGRAFVAAVRRRLEHLRTAGGENVDFVLDGRGVLTPGDAASICSALERFHLLWFDEPCTASSMAAVRKLSAESVTPIGFGRTIRHAGDLQNLLRNDAVDVVRPDVQLNGITQIHKMAALAEAYYVAAAPFHNGGPITTAAALHLAASIPNFFIQQFPLPEAEADHRMRAELTSPSVEAVRDGFASLPHRPGLGIDVSEEALEKYEER